jgi:hypothetical protein
VTENTKTQDPTEYSWQERALKAEAQLAKALQLLLPEYDGLKEHHVRTYRQSERQEAVFVKLVVAIPNKFHCSYDALLSLGFDSSFERSGLSQTLSGNSQSLVEPVQRSGCLAFANS